MTGGEISCDLDCLNLRILEVDKTNINLVTRLAGTMPLQTLALGSSYDVFNTLNATVDSLCHLGPKFQTLRSLSYWVDKPPKAILRGKGGPNNSHRFWLRMIGRYNPLIVGLSTVAAYISANESEFENTLLFSPKLEILNLSQRLYCVLFGYNDSSFVKIILPRLQRCCPNLRKVDLFVKGAGDVWKSTRH